MLLRGKLFVTIVTVKSRPKKTVVTVGSVKIPIYETPHGDRSRFTVCWYEAGRRKRAVRDDLADAKALANDTGIKLCKGHHAALTLTAADHESYVLAKQDLPEGVPLHEVVKQWKAATAALPVGASLLDAARAYAKREAGHNGKTPVTELVEAFIKRCEESRDKGTLSVRYIRTLRTHLRRFAAAFQMPIGMVDAGRIDDWLRRMTSSPKYWNNFKTSLVTFFHYAREKGHLPTDVPTAPEKVKRQKLKDNDIGILAPAQLAKLLKSGGEEARLYLALGAFSGMRVAEMTRLTWERFDFEMGLIRLDRTITKTGQKRNVPILPALAAWLEGYQDRRGRVFSSEDATKRTIRFARGQGVDWPTNCLRHSFCSYRIAAVKNQPQVALEAGNSVRMIQRHYDSVTTEKESTAWFGIMPEAPANVVSIAA